MVVFLVYFSNNEFFVFLKKNFEYFMRTISFVIFFGSIGALSHVVGILDAEKIIKSCLKLVVVFLVCFFILIFRISKKVVGFFMTISLAFLFSDQLASNRMLLAWWMLRNY